MACDLADDLLLNASSIQLMAEKREGTIRLISKIPKIYPEKHSELICSNRVLATIFT